MTGTALMSLCDVEFAYPAASDRAPVLRSITLDVDEGTFVSVTGRSGSGKSTLLALMALLDRPCSGTVRLDGIDVGDLSEGQRSELRGTAIGMVFQQFHLIERLTAIENVEIGLRYRPESASRRARAADALSLVGLSNKESAMACDLSGGERQRVVIARAIVGHPRLVLADEPTGNLDLATAASILDLLEGTREAGAALVVVTHDPIVAGRADRIVEISDGTVLADSGLRDVVDR